MDQTFDFDEVEQYTRNVEDVLKRGNAGTIPPRRSPTRAATSVSSGAATARAPTYGARFSPKLVGCQRNIAASARSPLAPKVQSDLRYCRREQKLSTKDEL